MKEKSIYRDGYPWWLKRKDFARGKVGRQGGYPLPASPFLVAVMGLGPHTLPGDESRAQEPFFCLIQVVTWTACFVYVYMQVSWFLIDRMQSECTLGADHSSQTTLLLPLWSPSKAKLWSCTEGNTAKNYSLIAGTYSQSLTLHQWGVKFIRKGLLWDLQFTLSMPNSCPFPEASCVRKKNWSGTSTSDQRERIALHPHYPTPCGEQLILHHQAPPYSSASFLFSA